MDINIEMLEELLSLKVETEWLEFKENWFAKDEIGEYISAISNGAAITGRDYGYIIWGIKDGTKEVVGTTVSFDIEVNSEPYKHYLARKLSPSIAFEIVELEYKNKKILVLVVPSARSVKTKFDGIEYIRIGSSKERISKFPEYDARLNSILSSGYPTMTNSVAPDYVQELTFEKLFLFYAARGIILKRETFEKTLKLRTKDGNYNVLAYVLSDQNSIPARVSIFTGKDKASPLFSVKEFGNMCMLYTVEKILEYGDAINVIQADERGRISERKDVPFFDYDAYREAILNAFIHNKWVTLNAPQISIFSDRIEILSHGGLGFDLNEEGFYQGCSMPVNEALASIYLQLRISERLRRGVPKIVSVYGRDAIRIDNKRIVVIIPFNKINVNDISFVSRNNARTTLNKMEEKIILIIRDNPNVLTSQLCKKTGLSESGVNKNIRQLKDKGLIMRIGSKKSGYWQVIEKE